MLLGRSITGIVEGNTVPQVFIPKLITLWRQGMFPFDKLIKTFGSTRSTKPNVLPPTAASSNPYWTGPHG